MKSRNTGINFDFPKRYAVDGSDIRPEVANLMFSNLVMDCGGHPIRILVEDGVKVRRVSGISFANIRARGGKPCVVKGNSDSIIDDVLFSSMRIETACESPLLFEKCSRVRMNDVEVSCVETG
jgi:hypothetical protein